MGVRGTMHVAMLAVGLLSLGGRAAAADRYVPAGGDLQAALSAARPGDTIRLEPGATFVGNFTLPAHGGTTYVTIRSAAPDSQLPAPGVRMDPSYAAHLPKLRSPNSQPALATRAGASYWRLLFLELQATDRGYYDILALGDGSAGQRSPAQVPQQLIVDRVYIHGDPLHGQKRGIALNSGATEIRNSYIAGIRAVGQDSQAIGGWNGPGPYAIENNYLEAAGEVLILGGSDPAIPDLVTSDVVIRRNTLTRPVSWRDPIVPAPSNVRATPGTGGSLSGGKYEYRVVARRRVGGEQATSAPATAATVTVPPGGRVGLEWSPVSGAAEYAIYSRAPSGATRMLVARAPQITDDGAGGQAAGSPPPATVWQVKNLLELKNARNVRISNNLLEHNWAQAQTGVAILFTPRNQDGNCRWCVVENVDFEHNVVRGVGDGITILGHDNEKPSRQARDIRIRHNLFLDVGRSWGGSGYFLHVMGEPRDIVIDHNTIISPDGAGVISVSGPPIRGFVFTNNLARHNLYGIIGADRSPGMNTIPHYFPEAVITRNVLADNAERHPYPQGNEFPSAATFEAQFVDYRGGNYALVPDSRWRGAGTDGLDLGAVREGEPTGRPAGAPSQARPPRR